MFAGNNFHQLHSADPVAKTPVHSRTPNQKAWRGNYCCVPLCRNSSGQQKERKRLGLSKISFHDFPKAGTVREKKWIVKIRRDPGCNFVINKHTKICSMHFTQDDFVSVHPDYFTARPRLKPNAVPSIFPWTTQPFQRNSITSQIASSVLQRNEYGSNSDHESSHVDEPFTKYDGVEADNVNDHVDCDEISSSPSREINILKLKIQHLQDSLVEAKLAAMKSVFCLENIKEKDELVKFYTGFPDFDTLHTTYTVILESDAKVMRQWEGKKSKTDYSEMKQGRACKLPVIEQFFLTLVRLRLGLFELDLANRFGISQSTVSRIIATWINLMYHSFKAIERFPPWHIVKKYMPEIFKKDYPNTRIIIDATEFLIERPSLLTQSSTFSAYKNRNTVKVLIGITPSGAISFVSQCYEGSILEKLEPGDEIMADKGFQIQDILAPLGVRLNVPPFLSSNTQMSAHDVILTKKIAHLRIHVERSIGRIKEFHILQGVLPAALWDTINQVVYVCCMLTNFSPPLVS